GSGSPGPAGAPVPGQQPLRVAGGGVRRHPRTDRTGPRNLYQPGPRNPRSRRDRAGHPHRQLRRAERRGAEPRRAVGRGGTRQSRCAPPGGLPPGPRRAGDRGLRPRRVPAAPAGHPPPEYLLPAGDHNHLQALAAFAGDATLDEKQRLLVLYEELAVNYPDRVGLMLGRAMLLRQVERVDESLAFARKVVKKAPENETGQLLLAQLLHQSGAPDKAIKALEKALAIDPESKRL